MNHNGFVQLLMLDYENRAVEFKGPGMRGEHPLSEKVVRAVIGMANLRGGGHVIIGVSDESGKLCRVGLSPEQLESWMRKDEVDSLVNKHADPPIQIDLEQYEHEGKSYVIIIIQEFEDTPIICKQEYTEPRTKDKADKVILRRGAIYQRSRHKAETAEMTTHSEMREVLELAVEKRLQRFVAQLRSVGLLHSNQMISPSDDEQYMKDTGKWDSDLQQIIRSRGYWDVMIRPQRYQSDRVASLADLELILQSAAVRQLGWYFPHIENRMRIKRGKHWIEQESRAMIYYDHLEAWRFGLNSEFRDLSSLYEDWIVDSSDARIKPSWQSGEVLAIETIMHRITEIYEFATHLCLAEAYHINTSPITITFGLHQLKGRHLFISSPGRWPLSHIYQADIDDYEASYTHDNSELIASYKDLAIEAARKMFEVFGWDASRTVLQGLQQEIWK